MPFWRMMHSSFRHSNDEKEAKRAFGVVRWIYQNRQKLEDSLESPEFSFLLPVLKNYELYSNALTADTYLDSIEDEGGKSWKLLSEMFDEYREMEPELSLYSEADLPQLLRGIVSLDLQNKMEAAWGNTKKILTSDPKIKVPGEEKMTRQEKAYSYLRSEMVILSNKLGCLEENGNKDVNIVSDADKIKEEYIVRKNQESSVNSLPIGIPEYDKYFDPQRGHFFGIQGFAGHRKSTLGRTWVYNTLAAGHNVAHFALEMGAKDEVPLYYLMHCRNKYGAKGFNKKAFNKGQLSEEAEELFYRSINSKSLKEDLPGEIFYRQRGSMTWFELAKELDDLIEQHGLSMAFIDYLTLIEILAKGNTREATDRMIQSVKPFCESRNLLLVSPIQGNRDGLERCIENEGQWDPQGIDTYSGYFRACDGIIGVYSPKESSNQMILSAVKNRHDIYPNPYTVNVCEETGYVYV